MFCFSLSGLFLLTGLVGRQLDISTCNCSKYFAVHRLFPVEHFQCLELSEVQNSTAAVLLRQPFYENSYTDAVCFKVAYRSLCLIIFLKANTSQSLLILLSRSLTRNTKRKSMSWGGETGFLLSQEYLYCSEKVSNNPLYLLILGIYLKIFHSDFIHNCLPLA